mmetsp:Transcript_3997/g.3345  ORF Transcript_3997/g.3345 Transcript_3997/m.3345 type:complete len:96 (+) Transcript_3997:549-836(+)
MEKGLENNNLQIIGLIHIQFPSKKLERLAYNDLIEYLSLSSTLKQNLWQIKMDEREIDLEDMVDKISSCNFDQEKVILKRLQNPPVNWLNCNTLF